MQINWDDTPHKPTVRTTLPSISLSWLLGAWEYRLLRYATAIGVIKVPDKAMMVPDPLAIVIAVSENPTSKRYVMRVAEYASTVIWRMEIDMDAGQTGVEK
jgi:hypothetical protein